MRSDGLCALLRAVWAVQQLRARPPLGRRQPTPVGDELSSAGTHGAAPAATVPCAPSSAPERACRYGRAHTAALRPRPCVPCCRSASVSAHPCTAETRVAAVRSLSAPASARSALQRTQGALTVRTLRRQLPFTAGALAAVAQRGTLTRPRPIAWCLHAQLADLTRRCATPLSPSSAR